MKKIKEKIHIELLKFLNFIKNIDYSKLIGDSKGFLIFSVLILVLFLIFKSFSVIRIVEMIAIFSVFYIIYFKK